MLYTEGRFEIGNDLVNQIHLDSILEWQEVGQVDDGDWKLKKSISDLQSWN